MTLTLKSNGRRKFFEWGQVHEIAGTADVPEWLREGYEPPPEPVFEPPPKTVPVSRGVPEEHMGREERRRVYEHRKDEPETEPDPVPDVEPEPAPGTLYDGVPAGERGAFTRWLNS